MNMRTSSREILFSASSIFFVFLLIFTASVASAATPSLAGCPLFPYDNVWNTPVDNMPVDPNSSAYISTIGPATGLHPDFGSGLWDGGPIGIPYTLVSGSQPKVPVTFEYAGESDPGPYPVPANAAIEGGKQSGGDRHVLVLDKDNCILYELYSAYPQPDGSWKAGSGAVFHLGSNTLRPPTWTSADAAGLPILPGLVRYDEVASGEINHALRFTVPSTRNKFIWPARHYASDLTAVKYPPMGQRFRLKADYIITGFSPEVQVILRALKRYGMVLADNGSSWYISGAPDPGWNNDILHELNGVPGSAFEAVNESSLMITSDSGKSVQAAPSLNPDPPAGAVRLIFIHHSTGENWLADSNGGLGISLMNNSYFVSDTNYGWGPGSIGDTTDIGNWWLWFNGPDRGTYLAALYAEGGQNCSYSRLGAAPAGPNGIVMFKSCFPNSALQGSPNDPVPPISSNPLRGQDSGSEFHTVANAKGIYIALLDYFHTRQDKLFVVVAAPPLSDPTYASNARAFNQWLVNEWLKDYPYRNVAVFDFYNVLTTNSGGPNTNDLGSATGNHHRFWNSAVQHKTDGDNDANPNVLEYQSGDDHPSIAGNLKATGEFQGLLNIFYNCWNGSGGCPRIPQAPTGLTAKAISQSKITIAWHDHSGYEAGFKVERKPGACGDSGSWTRISLKGENIISHTDTGLSPNSTFSYRVMAYSAGGDSASSNCSSAKTGLVGTPNSPSHLEAVSASTGRINLSWTDNSSNETAFRVYRKVGSGAWSLLHTVAADNSDYADTTATGNPSTTSYSYYVKACNSSGCSPATNTAIVPFKPTHLTAASSSGKITLSWGDMSGNESGFEVYRTSGLCASTNAWYYLAGRGPNISSYTDSSLPPGTSYAYTVKAYYSSFPQPHAYGYSLFSNCIDATTP
jgi:hypothetical protein